MKPKIDEERIKIGSLNFNTPFNLFLKNICHETLDTMIMHKNIVIEGLEKKCSIVLFKSKLVKSDIIDSKDFINDKAKLSTVLILEMNQLYSIEYELKENAYYINIIYMTINTGSGKPLNYTLMKLKFENINEGKIFRYFLEKQKNIYWQEFFEKTVPILPPYIYQQHFFLKKLNSRGDEDNRIIVLTDKYLLNVEYQLILNKKVEQNQHGIDFKLHKPKWALYIGSFDELQLVGKDKKKKLNDLMIKIKLNSKKNKDFVTKQKLPYKSKSSVDFIFPSEKICRFFIYQIKRLYFDITKTNNIKITENL